MGWFSLVPVLDLKGGQVVHARAGDRSRYLPIRTPLAPGSEPRALVEGLLNYARFPRFYIADLDAIEGHGNHRAMIADLARRYPGIEFCVDAGLATAAAAAALAETGAIPVLGSETLAGIDELAVAIDRLKPASFILSLDYRGESFLGPADLAERGTLWPARVIAMTLTRVGAGAGPDFARLADIRARAGDRKIFAAGGVRGIADITRLAASGIAGALVATALHDGRLDRAAVSNMLAEDGPREAARPPGSASVMRGEGM